MTRFGAAVIAVTLAATGLPAVAGAADAARGEQIYQRCIACHSLGRNRSGPKHCGLFGRRAGSLPDYAFSQAMAESGIVWNDDSLSRFLENPMKTLPGTKMGYAGVRNAQERADLIAYLRQAAADPEICR